MAFLEPKITNENESSETVPKPLINDEKKEKKIRLSKLEELGLCPHKAFPSKAIDRNKFESHSQYLEFLTQLKSYDKPWFIPPPTIAKRKLKLKPMQITNVHPLKKKAPNKDDNQEQFEDLSKYLVLQNTCENLKKCRKRKKNRRLSKSGVGYSIKVTDDLAFLLRTMADAREHLVQKAIENKWREEEEERRAKERGDIQALKNIVEGMMIKFIKIEEERQAQREIKEKQSSDEEKRPSKTSRESDDVAHVPGIECNQELTKDLVGLLKSLLEADTKRKERTYNEKETSITDLDQFVHSNEEPDKVEEEARPEEVEGEEKEEEKEEGDEKKEDEPGENENGEENNENEKIDDDDKMKEGEENVIVDEANVDMNEVNKKLEDLVMGAEGIEQEEKQDEEEEVEDEIDEWVKSLISPRPSPRIKVEASTQFDYALERKLALGIDREPKDVTEDLTVFLKTMMMADPSIREIIKEKELKEYWKKMENFDSWAGGGNDCKCDRKCCRKADKKKNDKQDKNKAAFKCNKLKKTKRKSKKCEATNDGIDLDNGYCLQPKEFLMLLQGVYNTLTIAEEIDEERKHHNQEHDKSAEESLDIEHSMMEPSLLVQLTDYINEVRSVIEDEHKEGDEERD